MAVVFQKTSMLTDTPFHYCPGCTHGIIHRLVAEVLEELGVGIRPSASRPSAARCLHTTTSTAT